MVLAGSQMRIRGVELFAVGQALVKGRYPIHYHVGGDQSASFVQENSIHDTFQRYDLLPSSLHKNKKNETKMKWSAFFSLYFLLL
jgi:hypothetical protein